MPARLAAAAALLAFLPGSAAAVAYVLYYHTFGDWAVVCWRSMVDGQQSCYIDAPPVTYNVDPYTSAVRIEPDGSGVHIVISARSGTRTGTPVRLAVDGQTIYEGSPDSLDHVSFAGAGAAGIVDVFRRGQSLVIELPELERKQQLSLAHFDEAFSAFKQNLEIFVTPHN